MKQLYKHQISERCTHCLVTVLAAPAVMTSFPMTLFLIEQISKAYHIISETLSMPLALKTSRQ